MRVSVVLATYNEEKNIQDCLDSIKSLASEIVIVDGSSTDKTVELAKKYTDKIILTTNPKIFHINKQKAIKKAKGPWILQLDADERVSEKLAKEIDKVTSLDDSAIEAYERSLSQKALFEKHRKVLEERDGTIGGDGGYNAFFIPRLNYFLGRYLKHGGVYPDGVIRLIKKGKAHFPSKSVHEQIKVEGKVGWLENDLLHMDSPTFERYLERNDRYINLLVEDFKRENLPRNFGNSVNLFLFKPISWFLLTQIRHKGFLDGFPGIVFSFFSALRFPRAYFRYLTQ